MNFLRPGSIGFSNTALNAGESVSALIDDMVTATEIVTPNWRYISPVIPGRKHIGTNIASNTAVVAITGPVTSSMDFNAASFGERFSSSINLDTFSITTIASSTTIPIARMSPKRVIRFIEYPTTSRTANVPISDTGIARVGTSVDRQSCKNINVTSTTRITASIRVTTTSSIEA